MDIVWLEDARNDLINYMKNSSIITDGKVEDYIINLVDYVDTLENTPYLGKLFFNHKGIEVRQLIYRMHRIIYYVKDNEVRILAVIHCARDIDYVMDYINAFFR